MPGPLRSVEQQFTADGSGYLETIRDMIAGNLALVDSIREVQRVTAEAQKAAGGVGGSAESIRDVNAAIRDQLAALRQAQGAVGDYSSATRGAQAASADFGGAQAETATRVRETTAALTAQQQQLLDIARVAQGVKNIQAVAAADAAAAQVAAAEQQRAAMASLTLETNRLIAANERLELSARSAMTAAYARSRSVSGAIVTDALSTLGVASASEGDSGNAVRSVVNAGYSMRQNTGGGFSGATDALLLSRLTEGMARAVAPPAEVQGFADTLAGAVAARVFGRGGGGAAAAAGAAAGAGGGLVDDTAAAVIGDATGIALGRSLGRDAGGGGLSSAVIDAAVADEVSRRYSSIIPSLIGGVGMAAVTSMFPDPAAMAASVIGRGAGNAARGTAVLGGYAAGAGLDALIGGAAAVSGGGAFDPGRAAVVGAAVTGWMGRVLPVAHYVMMAANEILATVGPAAIAGLAAGAVGTEGAQTGFGRLKAVNTVGQSLGPALGQTPGQFLGLGNALQKAQTAADPAVWELMGSAINDIKASADSASGGLSNFWQMGTSTIDMVDRFAAKVTTAFQGGEGKTLNSLVSQGTNDLQQFGDVLGNVGKTFLNVAPALPGVGGDLLTTLQGATKGLANVTGAIPTPVLGGMLAFEAGSRYGPALVGSAANLMARAPRNILGTAARAATADDVGTTINPATGAVVADEGEMIAGTGAAGALGSLGALDIGALAAGAYGIGKTITAQSPTQQWVGRLQTTANQADLSQSFGDLASNIAQFGSIAGGSQTLSPAQGLGHGLAEMYGHGDVFGGLKDQIQGIASLFGAPAVRTPGGTANAALTNAAQQFNDLLSAGPAMQGMLGGGSIANAYSVADMAGLQGSQLQQLISGSATQKADIRNQLLNEEAGYKVMASSPGVYGMNVNAVQAMSGLAGTQLSAVNGAWDQVLQNATGGTAAATGFAGGLQNFQALGGSLQAANAQAEATKLSATAQKESTAQIAKALTSFTSPASQAAWAGYSSPSTTSPGLLQQVESMTDSLRTAMTVSGGRISQGQFNQAAGYEAKQLLPYAKESPAALAQLGVLSQQMNGPAYNPALSQAENYKNISKAIDGAAGSAQQFTDVQNKAAIATAGVSQQALQFGATMKTNVYSALAGGSTALPQVSADMANFQAMASKMASGGAVNTGAFHAAAQAIAKDLAGVNASAKDTGAIIGTALQGRGLSGAQVTAAIGTVTGDMAKIQNKSVKVTATADAGQVQAMHAAISGIQGKTVNVDAHTDAGLVTALQSAIDSVHSKTVTVTTVVNTVGGGGAQVVPGGQLPGGTAGGPFPQAAATYAQTAKAAGLPANVSPGYLLSHGQTGMKIPGYGGGDIFPLMAEPGELVVPKHMVAAGMVDHLRGTIPGFAAGGVIPGGTLSAVNAQIGSEWASLDKLYAQNAPKAQISSFWQTVLDPLYAAKNKLTGATTAIAGAASSSSGSGTVTSPHGFSFSGTGSLAQMVGAGLKQWTSDMTKQAANQFVTSMNYARNVAAATVTGQGYGTQGLLSTFTTPPPGPSGAGAAAPGSPGYNPAAFNAAAANAASTAAPAPSVQQQMQSYLGTVQSFTTDLHSLTKEGLSKNLLAQLVAAGPVTGDADAQSILGTGVAGINSLWNKIGKASKGLGAQAAMSQYGGSIAPNLGSGGVSVGGVTINVNAGGGAAGNLNLTPAQIKTITEEVQAGLLKQARRNNKTGVQAKGKSS